MLSNDNIELKDIFGAIFFLCYKHEWHVKFDLFNYFKIRIK